MRPQRFKAVEVLNDAPALLTDISVCDLRAVVKPELSPPIVTLVPPKQSPYRKQTMYATAITAAGHAMPRILQRTVAKRRPLFR